MILFEATAEQAANRHRRAGRQYRPVHVLPKDGGQDVRDLTALEDALACQHLVRDDAERPDVCGVINGLSARLLRTHPRSIPTNGA
jgi:hypothetical protein